MKTTREIGKALFGRGAYFLLVLMLAGHMVDQTYLQPPPGIVSWWPGDGNANDIAGARNGSLVGSTGFAAGIVGEAFSFDGGSWVEVPDDPIWTLGTEDFTIDLWVRFNSLSGRDPFIAHDNGRGEKDKWIFWYDAVGHDKQQGVPALRFHINSPHPEPVPFPHDTVVAPWNPILGRWYHVALTRSGINYALYIDGVQVATDTSTFSIPDPVLPLTIGSAEAYTLNGLIDEVEIFDRALSAEEIQAIFNAGSAGRAMMVNIDIRPGSLQNTIVLGKLRVIPVAILSTPDFDATQIDKSSLTFGSTGEQGSRIMCIRGVDVNHDRLPDAICYFRTRLAGFQVGDSEGILRGQLRDGTAIEGRDQVKVREVERK